MARKDALIKLHNRLQTRRRELLLQIADELGGLRYDYGGRAGSDDLDAAIDSVNLEMTSQLAQMESRELVQIEKALRCLREGIYGSCEMCGKKIGVARLNALPYTTHCIDCQREMEICPSAGDRQDAAWQKVYESETRSKDVSSVKLSDLELKYTS